MYRVLIIDDEGPMRRLMRINLEDRYELCDTGDPELALAMVMQSKPHAILLDLRMPNYSGFELCRTLKSMTSTQLIPILIVSGEAGASTKLYCEELGATAYFEKPIDFEALRAGLAKALDTARPERRSEVRIGLRVRLKLRGTDVKGKPFEEAISTENVSKSAFLGGCTVLLKEDGEIAVSLVSGGQKFVGMARVVRSEGCNTHYPRYAFRFVHNDVSWILQ